MLLDISMPGLDGFATWRQILTRHPEMPVVFVTAAHDMKSELRALDDDIGREWRRALRSGEALSLLMIDIDHFKTYNDHYGHIEGDACLQQVAQAILRWITIPGSQLGVACV